MSQEAVPEAFAQAASSIEPCTVEIFRRDVPGDVRIWHWVTETHPSGDIPYPDPVSIIGWDQGYYVVVYIHLRDAVRRHLCGSLCVDIDIDTCGPSPDMQFPEQRVELEPCGSGWYTVVFELPPNTFRPPPEYPNRCGRIYRVCVTVGSHDECGHPGLIWAHCDTFDLAVHPPVPNP